MVLPEELQVLKKDRFFTSETGYDTSLQLSIKKMETDMILIYTNIDTLTKLANNLPIQMEIK